MRWPWLFMLVASAAAARPATFKRPQQPRLANSQRLGNIGQIIYVAEGRVYLDRGALDGLKAGQSLSITRRGGIPTTCTVEAVGDHTASCTGPKGIRVGDRFPVTPPDDEQKAKKLVEPTMPEALGPLLQRLEHAEVPLHDFDGTASEVGTRDFRADIRFDHTSWLSGVGLAAGSARERVEAQLRGLELYKGVRFSADLSVVAWSARPLEFQDVYKAPFQLFVRQVELSYRVPGVPVVGALGRINPRNAPGLSFLDGAQVGWKSAAETTEVGAYGGALPDLVTLAPLPRWAAGVYGTHRFEFGEDVILQPQLRLGFNTRPAGDSRFEGQLAVMLHSREAFDGYLEVLAGGGGQASSPGFVDAVRLDVSTNPVRTVHGALSFRYWGGGGDPYSSLVTLPLGHWVRGDARLGFTLTRGLELGAHGSFATDPAQSLGQTQAGGDLTWTTTGGHLGFTVSYDEELGWLRGRSGALQVSVQPSSRLRLLARASYFEQQGTLDAPGVAAKDLGGYLAAHVGIWRFLWARVSLLSRFALQHVPMNYADGTSLPDGTPVSLTVNASLGASF